MLSLILRIGFDYKSSICYSGRPLRCILLKTICMLIKFVVLNCNYLLQWFEEKQQQIENLDQQLRKLHSSVESLVLHRKGKCVILVLLCCKICSYKFYMKIAGTLMLTASDNSPNIVPIGVTKIK